MYSSTKAMRDLGPYNNKYLQHSQNHRCMVITFTIDDTDILSNLIRLCRLICYLVKIISILQCLQTSLCNYFNPSL